MSESTKETRIKSTDISKKLPLFETAATHTIDIHPPQSARLPKSPEVDLERGSGAWNKAPSVTQKCKGKGTDPARLASLSLWTEGNGTSSPHQIFSVQVVI